MTEKERELQEETFLDEQPLSDEDRELLERIYDRLDIFEEKNRPYHDEAKKVRRIIHMDDPDQDSAAVVKKNGKKTLQLQTLKSTLNNVVADQMLSMPEAKLLPEVPEAQQMADDLQDMVHYVIYCANNFEQIHYRRCEDFYGPGTAVTQIAWDRDMSHGRGEVAILRWPLEAFLWDPTAENIQDCRAVMKVAWHPLSWYRDHYPEQGMYVTADDGTHNNVGLTVGQEDADHASDEKRALMIEYWWREYDAKSRRYTINVAYAAGNALLEKSTDVYAHGLYPFVVDVHDSIEGSLAGEGLVHELAPMMRYINRYASYIDNNLRMSSKGRAIIRRGSNIDREAFADMDQDFVEGDRVEQGVDWNWIQNQPFNGMIANQLAQLQQDLKQDSGANQFTRGETTGGIVSGKAINSLIQAGGKVASMRVEQLKYGFKQIVEQIIWLMAQFYDDDRVYMITGRNANRQIRVNTKAMFGRKTKGAVTPPPYTVEIEVSSRDPQRIANQNQMFMEAYTMSAQAQQFFPLSSLFEILNLDGKDKILPVIRKNENYQQQMQALQQQIEQMGQQMEQMQKDNQTLRNTTAQMTNALATITARRGSGVDSGNAAGGIPGGAVTPVDAGAGAVRMMPASSGGRPAAVASAINTMGQQTGAELPS